MKNSEKQLKRQQNDLENSLNNLNSRGVYQNLKKKRGFPGVNAEKVENLQKFQGNNLSLIHI